MENSDKYLVRERGDEMDVDRMKSFILRLGNELDAAQQAAGVTSESFRRIKAECTTPPRPLGEQQSSGGWKPRRR